MTDPGRLTHHRTRLVDDALYDYVGMGRIVGWARQMTGLGREVDQAVLRDAVIELLTSLVGHDEVAVVTGFLDREYTDVAVLREAVEQGWADHDGRPLDGEIAWVVGRRYEQPEPLGPGERPAHRDSPRARVDDVGAALRGRPAGGGEGGAAPHG